MRIVELDTFYKHFPDQESTASSGHIGNFNIFKIEDILTPRGSKLSYSRRVFYKVSLVVGHSKIHYADQCIGVEGSVLVFTNPMVPYFWERISEEQSGFLCVFTEDFFNRFENIKDFPVFQNAANAIVPIDETQAPYFVALFEKMANELNGGYAFKYDLLRNQLTELIHSAQKLKPAVGELYTSSNAAGRTTHLFKELLERQFPIDFNSQVMQLRSAADFAGQLNLHVNHLNKCVREITGRTTSQLISERILQEAKILLKSTDWNIAEIAWSLAFKEPNHFSAFFKSHSGLSPAKFRLTQND
ncbi:helix-turn-helix transcriptional regulator [Pedobacter miscanthi]|jgi:AraC family transcriptional activator of pobA|uniref:helix-turn-helix domain-containing protein n=1 Tax=Pedobacter miscanthi TaxID=2259170 RepID=UPI00292D4340|nr:helix-turn-helix transcriptional regulator [Pedobacter miscanthi]